MWKDKLKQMPYWQTDSRSADQGSYGSWNWSMFARTSYRATYWDERIKIPHEVFKIRFYLKFLAMVMPYKLPVTFSFLANFFFISHFYVSRAPWLIHSFIRRRGNFMKILPFLSRHLIIPCLKPWSTSLSYCIRQYNHLCNKTKSCLTVLNTVIIIKNILKLFVLFSLFPYSFN
jgi:hypothetical protein